MIDPPRDEVKAAVIAAKEAGLRLMMITGDHHATARSIASAIGMAEHEKSPLPVINSDELHAMSDSALGAVLAKPAVVFSRVSPDEKLRIIEALQSRGDVVAVTGEAIALERDGEALRTSHFERIAAAVSGRVGARFYQLDDLITSAFKPGMLGQLPLIGNAPAPRPDR